MVFHDVYLYSIHVDRYYIVYVHRTVVVYFGKTQIALVVRESCIQPVYVLPTVSFNSIK